MSVSHRARVLALYRELLRAARKMPTKNRELYIKTKARNEFRQGSKETSPEAISELVAFAELAIESAVAQADHLTRLARDPDSFFPGTPR